MTHTSGLPQPRLTGRFLLAASLAALLAAAPAGADVEVTPPGSAVTASANDGNLPANAVDNSLATRWSASGDPQWIRFDLGTSRRVTSVTLAFFKGNERRSRFDLQVSADGTTWSTVWSGESSGTTLSEETFDVTDTNGRYVRYLGHGNNLNLWNSLTEANIFALGYVSAAAQLASASANDGNLPKNVLDKSLATRWAASGDGQWLELDLNTAQTLGFVKLAFYNGASRRAIFDLQVSNNRSTWTTVWSGQSSGTTTALETFDFGDVSARYVRYLGHGNSVNAWNSVTEAEVHVVAGQSRHVYVGSDGRLVYLPEANGDRLPDFSHAGYGGGGVALPAVAVAATVNPVAGDDGASIQAAINTVSARTPDANGFRGAVLLKAGTYEVSGSLTVSKSGVVLRGEGDGTTGTVIKATGTTPRTLINIAGVGDRTEVAGSSQAITSAYVPVGARSFQVADASGFTVGADVLVVRTPNQEWVDHTGTDVCGSTGTSYDTSDVDGSTCISESFWTPESRIMRYERKVTAVSGNTITVDAPLVEAIQDEFGGGYVARYQFPGRIEKVGVESLRAESDFASDTDENHATRMIGLSNVRNAWVRNVTSVYFVQGTVVANAGTKWLTVQDSASLDHKSQITGGRRYPFSLDDASLVLVMRCYAKTGRHDYVTGSNTPGPNVFLDSRAEESRSELGPHHRWATGTLFDSVTHQSVGGGQIIGAYNRGNLGSGHGWSGAYQLFWNCVGDKHKVSSPPAARNWSVGCRSTTREGTGEYDAFGRPVAPASLYLQQLRDRLGPAALTNIGY